MRRKIVKHGPSSFIVSLPLKWIRKHNLSKGDEVDVEEMEENVVISTEYKEKCERADLDMNDTKEMTIQKVCALYKRGIDEKVLALRVRKHCRSRMQSYKVPVKVHIVDNLDYGERFKKKRL